MKSQHLVWENITWSPSTYLPFPLISISPRSSSWNPGNSANNWTYIAMHWIRKGNVFTGQHCLLYIAWEAAANLLCGLTEVDSKRKTIALHSARRVHRVAEQTIPSMGSRSQWCWCEGFFGESGWIVWIWMRVKLKLEPWHPGPDHPGHARTRVHSNPDLQVENFHLGLYPNYTMRSDKWNKTTFSWLTNLYNYCVSISMLNKSMILPSVGFLACAES